MAIQPFKFHSITSYQEDLRNGSTTCRDAVQHYLDNIHRNEGLNAFVRTYGAEALAKADELDRQRKAGSPMGKLHGVVISLKDVICYKDHPVHACSKILEGYTAIYHATAVSRLLEEGAILIGHTNCDEFAMGSTNENSAYGPVKNGADPTKVPGGSSGGAAVAVQQDCCMVALGSDTGGSVRQPADFCGVIGLKPTYGRISRYGLIAYASSFDQIGILAKETSDIALTLEVISGPDDLDSTSSLEPVGPYTKELNQSIPPLKIAYFKEAIDNQSLDPEIKQQFLELCSKLKQEGHQVEAISFKHLDHIIPTYYILTTAEASSNLSRFDGVRYGKRVVDKKSTLTEFYCQNRSNGFGWEVKKRIMLGSFVLSAGYYDAYFTRAQKVRQKLNTDTQLIFKEFDAILLPNAPVTAFPLGEKMNDPIAMYLSDIFTVFANLTGLPAISIPLFWHSNGLPFGVQLIANRFSELSLLRLTQQWMNKYRETRNQSISGL
ncbi:MAG: Asp-tRNA(Asn)/Glu-tRNA(Gln) amidotransferase subunit GatA [Bacteroidota bacterium]